MKKIILTALIASSFGLNATVTEVGSIADPAIPDNTCANPNGGNGAGGISNLAVFAQAGTISDMNVDVAITHTWRGDLQMDITYSGTEVIVWSNTGGSVDDFFGIFDDQGAAACDGTAAVACNPQNPLSAFNGLTTPGSIQLNLCDEAGGDTGTLDAWSVTLEGQPGDGLPVELMNLEIE